MIKRSRCKVLPTVSGDIAAVLEEGLRKQDLEECAALGTDPASAVPQTVAASGLLAFTVHVDGKPAGLFGVCMSDDPETGIVWMVGTERLLEIPRELIFEARRWIDYLNTIYPVLTNWVSTENTVSLRWLKLMGFEFPHTADFTTPAGVVFEEFRRCA